MMSRDEAALAAAGWVVFTGGRLRGGGGLTATLYPTGYLRLSAPLAAQLGEAVQLAWHAGRRAIGLRPVPAGTKGAYRLTIPSTRAHQRRISLIAFLRYHQLDPKTLAGVYPATQEGERWVLLLPPPNAVGGPLDGA